MSFATEFARRNADWIARELIKRREEAAAPTTWDHGTEFLFHGERVALQIDRSGALPVLQFADHTIPLSQTDSDFRRKVENYLWSLAEKELPPRTWQLAGQHHLPARRVVVRNQRSRWGSCSVKGTISLNWRLIQAPSSVRDYLILHELAHLREMNHSERFWRLVELLCPQYALAERWLNEHSQLIRLGH